MSITKDTAVTIAYRITDARGKPLDAGTTAYLHGGHQNLFPKVEAALEGKGVGDQVALDLAVADAFGERDEALVRTIPKSEFPPGVKVGGRLQGPGPEPAGGAVGVADVPAAVLGASREMRCFSASILGPA